MAFVVTLLIIYAAILAHDIPKLKERKGRTVLVYTLLMMVSLYQSAMLVFDLEWSFVHTLFETVFGRPAGQIKEFLKVSS